MSERHEKLVALLAEVMELEPQTPAQAGVWDAMRQIVEQLGGSLVMVESIEDQIERGWRVLAGLRETFAKVVLEESDPLQTEDTAEIDIGELRIPKIAKRGERGASGAQVCGAQRISSLVPGGRSRGGVQ